jgi:hypothetical protein
MIASIGENPSDAFILMLPSRASCFWRCVNVLRDVSCRRGHYLFEPNLQNVPVSSE